MHDVVQRSRRPSFVCSRGERDRDKGDKSVRGGGGRIEFASV